MRRLYALMLFFTLLLPTAAVRGEETFFVFGDDNTATAHPAPEQEDADHGGVVFSDTTQPAEDNTTAEPAPETDSGTGEATPAAQSSQLSPPYSSVADGSYWSMTPGEIDDAAIWDLLMQPITVYDGGLDQRDHVYLMENPDGTGKQVAQVHGQSQGLHVIGETNEHGYVLVETFSSYDDKYFPSTDEEKEHAFELKQGYVKASGLKEVAVQQDIALLIDKLTQRMYIFRNGERVAELLVSTGLILDGKYYRETPAGEFITVSHVGPFDTNKYMKSDLAIRISGGILIHEVPYEPLGDGSRRYSDFEAKLGGKASAGCIRTQRQETAEGYNQQWIWDNLQASKPYKVIIWDDVNRVDTPTTQHPNPGS